MKAILLAALIACATSPLAASERFSTVELMLLLAHRGPVEATFTERRFVPVLDRPVESAGRLRFVPPARLEKHVERPRPESMVVDGDLLMLQQGNRKRSVPLTALPEAALLIDSLRATLAGDLDALQRGWTLSLTGDRARWTLSLEPSAASLAQLVSSVRIEGRENDLYSIEVQQTDGVRSVMQVRSLPPRTDR